MDGNVAVEERPQQPEPEAQQEKKPIVQDSKELEEIRRRVRKIDYGIGGDDIEHAVDAVGPLGDKEKKDLRKHRAKLPDTEQELRDRMDKKFREIINDPEEENIHREHVPHIALRHLENKDWKKETGWDYTERDKVVENLQKVLDIEKYQAKQIMYMLVAANKKPHEVLAKLNEDNQYKYYLEEYNEAVITRARAENDPNYKDNLVENIAAREISNRYMEGITREAASKYLFVHNDLGVGDLGEMSNDYILRFGLDKEFRKTLDLEFDNTLPQNLFDLAWNMSYKKQQDFGMNGRLPVLQMQVRKNDKTGAMEGRYVVNQSNDMHWLRDQMWEWYEGFDTQDVTDYFSKVEIKKGPMYSVNLITMLFDKDRYWRDETGYMWERLYNQVLLEPWMLLFLRTYAVEYDKVSGDDEKLVESYKNLFHLSKLTMKILGKSMVEILTTLPEDFEGVDSDTKVGEAWLKMFLAYYNLADFEELKSVLGKDSGFFTRKGWMEAAEKVFEPTVKRTHMPPMGDFFGERQRDDYAKAFDEDGNVTTPDNIKHFLKFINIYDSEHPSTNIHLTLDQILKDSVASLTVSKEGNLDSPEVMTPEGMKNKKLVTDDDKLIDKTSLNYAWLIAHAWTHFSGALARGNFPSVSGHFAETKWFYTDAYRDKYMKHGGAGAFPAIHMLRQTSLPLMEGILLENAFMPYVSEYKEDKNGNLVPVIKRRQMVPMEVFKLMNEGSNEREAQRKALREQLESVPESDTAEKASIMRQIDEVDENGKNEQKMRANQLEFNENALRVYSKNLAGRGADLFKQLLKGEETDFDAFTTDDGMFRGPSFHQAKWQAALQEKLITPLRYLFDANGAMQLNMKQRFPLMVGREADGTPIYEWKTMYVGERMMGHQVLDIPQFRKRLSDVSKKKWEKMQDAGYKKKGKYIVRPDGRYDINFNRVQADKPMVYKQWMLMKLAADLLQHVSRHSANPNYSLYHYETIIKAIEELPANLDADEFNIEDARVTKSFFSEEQIAWLRGISGWKKKKRAEFLKAYFMGDPRRKEQGGISDSTNIILNAIFRGY